MIADVADVSSGREHTCAALDDSTAWCWGENVSGQLGIGTPSPGSTTPVRVMNLGAATTQVVQVGAGDNFSCARTSTGAVYCWGSNNLGQVGDGTTMDRPAPRPVSLGGLTAIDLAVGRQHACIVTSTARVACWGHNINGQLGIGNNTIYYNTPQTNSVTSAVGVTAGSFHSCAVRSGGQVLCWGDNASGQLGDGTTTSTNAPVAASVSGVTFDDVDAGSTHTCAHTSSNQIYCWGGNASGQLGNGGTSGSAVPISIGTGYSEVAVGSAHTCARNTSDRLYCWGNNNGGKLGDGTTTFRTSPTPVVNIPPPP
jgi:alpha-tubulin suppressor-like RCC1 family protein